MARILNNGRLSDQANYFKRKFQMNTHHPKLLRTAGAVIFAGLASGQALGQSLQMPLLKLARQYIPHSRLARLQTSISEQSNQAAQLAQSWYLRPEFGAQLEPTAPLC
jgi:hypothetical protein